MDNLEDKNDLLIFRDVFLSDLEDYVNNKYKEKIMDITTNNDDIIRYIENFGEEKNEEDYVSVVIPKHFKNFDEWLIDCNLHCWYCSLKFTSIPVFIPIELYKNIFDKSNIGNDYICKVHGIYCSWNCVISYASENFSETKYYDIIQNIYYVRKCINDMIGKDTNYHINKAPSKTYMVSYRGGDGIREEEYRKYCYDYISPSEILGNKNIESDFENDY